MSNEDLSLSKVAIELVQNNLERIITGIYKVGTDEIKQLKIRTQKAFETYLEKAIDKYGRIKTLINRTEPVNLYNFYVHTEVKFNDTLISTEDINSLLQINKNIMILGSGGTGKSTLFKHLFLNSINKTNKIPIFVQLRNLNDNDFTLDDCIYESLTTLGFCLERDYFFQSLDQGRYIFFFDGFDEVEDNKKSKLVRDIINMTTQYNENHFLVSSRNFDKISMNWDNFADLIMQPLDKDKAIKLIKNIQYEEEIKEKFLLELNNNLFSQHVSFCSNPLLLTLMLMTFDEFSEIPDKIHIFYGQAFDVLYYKHDATKPGFKRPRKTKLASDEFGRIIEAISAFSYLEKNISFENNKLVEYIHKARQYEGLDFDIDDYKSDLVEVVCVLILDGLKYNYHHRSFQEYFTAKFITRQTDELQNRFASKIFREQRLQSDRVVDLIFDIDKIKMEKNVIIPMLTVVKQSISANSKRESLLKYIENYYSRLDLSFKPSHEGVLVIPYFGSNHLRPYRDELSGPLIEKYFTFVISKYLNFDLKLLKTKNRYESVEAVFEELKLDQFILNEVSQSERIKEKVEIIRNMGARDRVTRISLNLNDVLSNKDFHNTLFVFSEYLNFAIEQSLHILEKLEKEHAEREILGDLFL